MDFLSSKIIQISWVASWSLKFWHPKRDGTKSVGKSPPTDGDGWASQKMSCESLGVIHAPPWKNLGWRDRWVIKSPPKERIKTPIFWSQPKNGTASTKTSLSFFPNLPSTWTPPAVNKKPTSFSLTISHLQRVISREVSTSKPSFWGFERFFLGGLLGGSSPPGMTK